MVQVENLLRRSQVHGDVDGLQVTNRCVCVRVCVCGYLKQKIQ